MAATIPTPQKAPTRVLPGIPSQYVNDGMVTLIDVFDGTVRTVPSVDAREMLAVGSAKLPEVPIGVDGAKAPTESEAPGEPDATSVAAPGGAATASTDAVAAMDLESMTAAQLKAVAQDAGVKGYGAMTKAELIEALKPE